MAAILLYPHVYLIILLADLSAHILLQDGCRVAGPDQTGVRKGPRTDSSRSVDEIQATAREDSSGTRASPVSKHEASGSFI